MKKYLKVIIIYSVLVTTCIRILAEIIGDERFYTIGGYLTLLTLFVMLVHIGMIMQNMLVKKKYFTYIGIVFGEVLAIILLSALLDVSTVNTWLGFIGANAIFITILVMLFDIAKTIKNTDEKASRILKTIGFVGAVIIAHGNVMTIIIGF